MERNTVSQIRIHLTQVRLDFQSWVQVSIDEDHGGRDANSFDARGKDFNLISLERSTNVTLLPSLKLSNTIYL
jgi:hypothetical protein